MAKSSKQHTDHRIADQLCPSCGHRVDHAGSPDKPLPQPAAGDWCVCIRCAAVTIYGEDFRLRLLNEAERAELAALPADHEVRQMQALVLMMGQEMPWPKEQPN